MHYLAELYLKPEILGRYVSFNVLPPLSLQLSPSALMGYNRRICLQVTCHVTQEAAHRYPDLRPHPRG